MKYDFEQINVAFEAQPVNERNESTEIEKEMYALYCMLNRMDVSQIDFSRLDSHAVAEAYDLFEQSVRSEDQDGTIYFLQDSPWSSLLCTLELMWNFAKTETKKPIPAFPLI
ncbi:MULTISPECIES: hypothetical protein [unclassified Planococcus (in: firmicutes)]|uniref:hypothetical protein n=1 Tax=unclassified Planococcus (in: firmicutes) TaxID=2662419 RepID=UPI000C341499|nr:MULTISPECIES: hypothetical protein [unclassified Planococcus (in: firmicutes)]AUD12325.1 hypothetical protein CW734_00145 [Planococcus sp. MB-3u-03]PKG46591.1 hypothetical protein CXF66_06870 [Planococcus sp. Urea-trap-24]PKG89723.1 hypothetical protein CXF91_05935 [Planococcus sp. Urea-3u-39]PKH40874.1 hypothetical protein CXF77_07460 [Planococcus sp. MB-3u-09]